MRRTDIVRRLTAISLEQPLLLFEMRSERTARMRLPALAPICLAAALTAACDGENSVRISATETQAENPGVLKVIDTLQCPETIGVLTRKGSAHDGGDQCLYTGPRGAEVSLKLVRLDDQPIETILDRFEQDLLQSMPHTAASLAASQEEAAARAAADAASGEAEAATDQARDATAEASGESARVRAPGLAVDAEGDRANVRLPGLTVDAEGDQASVRIGGFSIEADDSSGTVDVSSANETVSVQARDDAAEIRTRVPGDAVRTTYILTDNRPADQGWRLVGFEARGPSGGPVVIAVVHAKDRNSDGVFDSAKELVTLNVGE